MGAEALTTESVIVATIKHFYRLVYMIHVGGFTVAGSS